jgi:hypothetical protein
LKPRDPDFRKNRWFSSKIQKFWQFWNLGWFQSNDNRLVKK